MIVRLPYPTSTLPCTSGFSVKSSYTASLCLSSTRGGEELKHPVSISRVSSETIMSLTRIASAGSKSTTQLYLHSGLCDSYSTRSQLVNRLNSTSFLSPCTCSRSKTGYHDLSPPTTPQLPRAIHFRRNTEISVSPFNLQVHPSPDCRLSTI